MGGKSREVGGDKNNRWTTDRETDPLWSAFINPLFALLICITSSYSSFTNTLQAMIYILLLLAVLMVLHWILSVTELHLVGTALHILGRCVAWCWSGIGGVGRDRTTKWPPGRNYHSSVITKFSLKVLRNLVNLGWMIYWLGYNFQYPA